MKQLFRSVALALTIALASNMPAPAFAQASDTVSTEADRAAIAGVLDKATAAFNSGDLDAYRALLTRDVTVIDEIPPYLWSGADGTEHWLSDLTASEAVTGRTGGQVRVGKIVTLQQTANAAYVVTEATYSFDQKGVPTVEDSTWTWTLLKAIDGWKITAWAWGLTGTRSGQQNRGKGS